MPELESVRTKAEAIGRVKCIETGAEIGLLYRWDNGETQAAMYESSFAETPTCSDHPTELDPGAKRG